MNVSLTPQLEAIVRKKVESGMYGNASEVIREAIRIMDQRDQLARLRAELAEADEQIDRGEYVDFTPDFFERLDRDVELRIAAGVKPNPDVLP